MRLLMLHLLLALLVGHEKWLRRHSWMGLWLLWMLTIWRGVDLVHRRILRITIHALRRHLRRWLAVQGTPMLIMALRRGD